jgi:hypothetical protein
VNANGHGTISKLPSTSTNNSSKNISTDVIRPTLATALWVKMAILRQQPAGVSFPKFKAQIEASGSGGAYVLFPYDTEKEFATNGKVPVKVTFNP